MLKAISSAVLGAMLLAACATTDSGPTVAAREGVLLREAVVESVDLETRELVLTGQEGKRFAMTAGPEVRNLAQVRPGDRVRLGYYEAVAARVADPNDPGGAIAITGGERAELGERPGVAVASVENLVVEFVSFDPVSSIATLVLPDGKVATTRVHPKMREFAEARRPGDRIEITIEQAIAISVEAL